MTPEIQLKATGKGEEWCHQMQAVFEMPTSVESKIAHEIQFCFTFT